jgi:hypothetical protein
LLTVIQEVCVTPVIVASGEDRLEVEHHVRVWLLQGNPKAWKPLREGDWVYLELVAMGCTAHAHKIAPGRKGGEASLGEGNCWYPLTQQVNLHKMHIASQDFLLLLAVKAMSFPWGLVRGAEDFNHGDHFPSRRMDDLHEGLPVFYGWDGDSEGGVCLRRGNRHFYTYWGHGWDRPPH